jgi:hypothetical protein
MDLEHPDPSCRKRVLKLDYIQTLDDGIQPVFTYPTHFTFDRPNKSVLSSSSSNSASTIALSASKG